jgi:hypothetical protein
MLLIITTLTYAMHGCSGVLAAMIITNEPPDPERQMDKQIEGWILGDTPLDRG